jgi:curved DNA-binding protein CbpA
LVRGADDSATEQMNWTFYDVLGLPPDATQSEVRAAYRRKVKEHHPDVSDHPDAEARFRAVVRAEEVLGDADERARYDDLGHEAYLRVVGDPRTDEGAGDWEPAADDWREDVDPWNEDVDHEGDDGDDRVKDRSSDDPSGSRSDGEHARRAGGDRRDEETWWEDVWEPGTGENQWRQTADPERRSYSVGGDDGGTADERSEPSAGVRQAVEDRRKRRQASGREGTHASGVWDSSVDGPVEPKSRSPVASKIRSRDAVVLSAALVLAYPAFVYFAVTPAFGLAANLTVGLVTVGLAVFLLTEPAAATVVFGFWSLAAPLLMLFMGSSLLSGSSLAALGAFWVPLALTLLILLATPG